jgi:hypothetical protein
VLGLELTVDLSPIGLGMTAMALLDSGCSKECRLQCGIGHLSGLRRHEIALARRRSWCISTDPCFHEYCREDGLCVSKANTSNKMNLPRHWTRSVYV